MPLPDVSIVIVSWNVRNLLHDCLESILDNQGQMSLEIIVVDNVSGDGTPEMLNQHFPAVQLIQPGENTGFSKGNNIGIRASSGKFVLLLNPDTLIVGPALQTLADFLTRSPTTGVIGPQLLNEDGSVQSSIRRFPTVMTGFFESTWLQSYTPRRILEHYYISDHNPEEIRQVDWLQGAALLVRQETIADVGLLDEQFFMYSEELDWQRRIKEAGWDIVYYPQAQIMHYGGKSSEQVVAKQHIYFQVSKIAYFKKYHGTLAAWTLRMFLLTSYLIQIMLEGVKGLLGHKRKLRYERTRAYWQVIRSGLRN